MILGVGSFAHSIGTALADAGADVSTYLTRNYGHFSPSLVGKTFSRDAFPSPVPLMVKNEIEVVIPQSIDWATAAVGGRFGEIRRRHFQPDRRGDAALSANAISPANCARSSKFRFPNRSSRRTASRRKKFSPRHPQPFVIKNPLCSPTSPVHTILCETVADTRAWLRQVNYAEGVFLQEYLGRAEAGHIALVSGGEIYSLVTNQEYKYAFNGNLGIVAGAPLGGLVERDENDKYGLARELIHPLLPWLRKVNYHGPIQVTAIHVGQASQPVSIAKRASQRQARRLSYKANGTSSNTTSASASRPAR